jgi:hypothetical protein
MRAFAIRGVDISHIVKVVHLQMMSKLFTCFFMFSVRLDTLSLQACTLSLFDSLCSPLSLFKLEGVSDFESLLLPDGTDVVDRALGVVHYLGIHGGCY